MQNINNVHINVVMCTEMFRVTSRKLKGGWRKLQNRMQKKAKFHAQF